MTLADSLRFSALCSASQPDQNWITSPELTRWSLQSTPETFLSVTSYLIANPNRNTSHLFRADILHDTAGLLQTPEEKERELLNGVKGTRSAVYDDDDDDDYANGGNNYGSGSQHPPSTATAADTARLARLFPGFKWKRTVVRRFIPRNRKLDRELDQTCHFYDSSTTMSSSGGKDSQQGHCQATGSSHLVIYTPHASGQDELPWYHPAVRALAFLYEFDFPSDNGPQDQDHRADHKGRGTLSLHFLPFASTGVPAELPHRLERTLLELTSTQARLIRGTSQDPSPRNKPKPYKDNIIPQHVLQNTYMRLKDKYAVDLISNWVESTEPSKHVFEDINIAAFLIELWKLMYSPQDSQDENEGNGIPHSWFPGFVDIACGNGVLVHILLSEGYRGWGFDARRRKTWSILPPTTEEHLKETICIPRPFKDALGVAREQRRDHLSDLSDVETHEGIFTQDTFIISNHADELTVWTPLLGMLSSPTRPLPFLAIPCCSHALSGARFRYPPPQKKSTKRAQEQHTSPPPTSPEQASEPHSGLDNPQPSTGDLKALRDSKRKAQQDPGSTSSTYGSLTSKVVHIAEEVGYDIEKTLLRIPSTRKMGIIGGLKTRASSTHSETPPSDIKGADEVEGTSRAEECIREIIERESMRDGGVEEAASLWVERSLGLQKTQGKGKVRGGAQHG